MTMQAASLDILEKANVPAPQARAIVQAIEIEITGAQTILATKQDLFGTKQELLGVTHPLELKIELLRSDLLRHLYTAMMGQTGLLVGMAYFFVTHLKP